MTMLPMGTSVQILPNLGVLYIKRRYPNILVVNKFETRETLIGCKTCGMIESVPLLQYGTDQFLDTISRVGEKHQHHDLVKRPQVGKQYPFDE